MTVPVYDPSINAKNQHRQGGADWVIAGNLNIDEANGGVLYVGGQQMTLVGKKSSITITPAAGTPSSNVCLVTIQVNDVFGNPIASKLTLDVWLSDSAAGTGLTATTASGAVAAGTVGTDLLVRTAKKETLSQTNAAGEYILSITDSAKTGFYIAVQCGDLLAVSAQLVTANYG